jgi:hypothetical protein
MTDDLAAGGHRDAGADAADDIAVAGSAGGGVIQIGASAVLIAAAERPFFAGAVVDSIGAAHLGAFAFRVVGQADAVLTGRAPAADDAAAAAVAIVVAQVGADIAVRASATADGVALAAEIRSGRSTGARVTGWTAITVAVGTAKAGGGAAAVDGAAVIAVRAAVGAAYGLADTIGGRLGATVAAAEVSWAAELFAIAGAKAALIVATFGVAVVRRRISDVLAACRPAIRFSIGTATAVVTRNLVAGAAGRSWGWGGTAAGFGVILA